MNDLPLFSQEQIALIHDGEAARVDFLQMASAGGHENDLSRTASALVNGIAALRAASVPVRLVCDVMHCSASTVLRVEAGMPHLVVTLRARLGQGMLRSAALAMEELTRRLELRPGELGYDPMEAGELVAAAEKMARAGSELVAAGAPASGGDQVASGGYEAFVQALKRAQAGPVDVASSVERLKQAESGGNEVVSAAPVVGEGGPVGTGTGSGRESGRADGEGDQGAKGGEGVAVLTGGGGDGPMQTGGGNFGSKGEGAQHGVD